MSLLIGETFEKCSICPRSRKAKMSTTGIYLIFRGLRFEPDAEIGQISTVFERGRFAKLSWEWKPKWII